MGCQLLCKDRCQALGHKMEAQSPGTHRPRAGGRGGEWLGLGWGQLSGLWALKQKPQD